MPEYIRDHNTHPPLNHPGYDSTRLRHPRRRLTLLPHMLTEITSPVLGEDRLGEHDHDLTRQHGGNLRGSATSCTGRSATATTGPSRTVWWKSGRPTPPDVTGTSETTVPLLWAPTSPGWGVP